MKPRTAVKLVSVFIVLFFQIIGIAHGQSINVTSNLQPFSSCPGVASSTQTVFVSGTSLTANVVVTAPSGYEVSNESTGPFSSNINLSPVTGSLSATVTVRLSSSATNGASGDIQFSSVGATTKTAATKPAILSLPTISIKRVGGISEITSGCANQTFLFSSPNAPSSSNAWTSTPSGLFNEGANSIFQSVTPTTPGTYSVVYKDLNGCQSSPVNFTVRSSPSPPTVSTTPVNYCLNDVATSLTATASAGNELRWYGTTNPMAPNATSSATATIPLTSSAGTRTYFVTQRNADGCESIAQSIRVIVTQVAMTINTISDVPTSSTSFSIPYAGTVGSPNKYSISASSSNPLSGFLPVTNESFSSSPITVNLPSGLSVGTYDFDFTLKNANNCTRSYTVSLNVVSATSPRISTTGTVSGFSACIGTTSVAQSVSVTAANLTNDLSIAAPTGYQVSLSSSSGFASSVSITPVAGSVSSTSVFLRLASSATNGASGNLVFSSTGATSQSIATGSATIFNKTTLMGTLSACIGGTSILTPNEGPFGTSTPIWTTSNPSIVSLTDLEFSSAKTANALAQGSSTITYTDRNGCNSDPYNFVVNALPTVSGPTSVCVGSEITLTGSGTPTSNPWSASNSNINLLPDFPVTRMTVAGRTQGSSIITYNLGGGCTTTTTISVSPELSITSSTISQQVCLGATPSPFTVNPTGSGSFTYQWYSSNTMSTSGGTAISGATNSSYTPPVPTSTVNFYFYPIVSNGQCSKTGSSYTMTVNPTPATPTISSLTSSVCNSGSFSLTANSTGGGTGGTIKWYAVATGGTPLFTFLTYATPIISTTTTYYVDVTNSSGCVSPRTAYTAIVNQTPVFTTQPTASSAVCLNGTAPTLTVAASGGSITYAWYRNTTNSSSGGTLIPGNNTATYTPPSTSAGTTYYYAQASNACTGSTPVASNVAGFTVNPLPTAPLITASGATSICTGQTVILTSSYATGNVWYKDGVVMPSGTSASITVSSAGSYTVEHTNANGCLSPASTATQVLANTTPTVSSTTPANHCDAGTLVLGATASAGTLNWYAASTGGASLGTGTSFTTPSINATTTYYVDATNNGCTSARTAVVATVNTTPSVSSSTPAARCDVGTVVLGATASAGTLNWYVASTGGTSLGTGTSFTTPSISATTTYYVDATNNGCTSARTAVVATVNTTPSVASTTPANRCGPGILTLSATASAGTLNWYSAQTGGSLLGTGTSYTTPSISATTTYYVDAVRNGCTSNRSPVVAAINTSNPITAQPISNTIVCTTDNQPSLSVTTNGGGLSYQWYSNTNNSNSGGNIINSANASTYNPSFNTAGQLYYYVIVTDANCSVTERSSIARVEVKTTPTVTSPAPGSRCDAGTVILGATASAGTLSWYAASTGGTSLGTGTSFTTPSISATRTYHVEATSNGCTSVRTAVLATVNTTPSVSSSTPAARCDVGTVVLGATASAGTLNWYAASTGGTSLGTGTSFTTPSINTTTTYYVDATINGCTSARSSVVATVNTTPTVSTTAGSRCDAGTVVLGATASAGTLNWYAASTGGASLGTGTSYTTPSISATTTYYVDATNNGCTTARTAVVATVNTTPTVSSTTPGSRCDAGTVVLGATASAGTLNWYAASTGGASLGTGTSFTTPRINATTTYYVDATNNGCTTARTAVVATVNTTPSVSSSTPSSRCDVGTVVLGATASAGTLNWYVASTGGTSLGTGTSFTTPSINATTTYYVDATNNGCTSVRTSIVATVTAPPSAGTLSGTQGVCVGLTTTFVSTVTGGTWSTSNTLVATVSTSGVITGVAAGTATITYTVTGTGGCADASVTRTVTVTAPPSAGTLSGTQGICVAGTTTFVSTVNGGTWSSSDQTVATVSTSGVITGVAAGTATITYTVAGTGGCADASVTRTVTVTAPPSAGTLSGTQAICVAGTTTFVSTVTGGTWSSSDQAVATVSTSGVITGVAAGTATITYTVAGSGGCADAVVTRTVTVNALPVAGNITGNLKVAPFTSHTYSIAAVANAQVYKWILPSGWTGTSDINTIDVQSGTNSGEITVQVINTNGCQSNISKIMVVVDAADTDNDGVPNLVEDDEGTNKNDAKLYKDTDKDGVPDYLEKVSGTSVTDNKQFIDSDAGGTPDYVETKLFVVYGLAATDPNNSADDKRDTDEDKTSDYQEILNGTNPNDAPANLQYSPNSVIITIGNPLNVSAPTYTAGKPKKYSITPVLPAGIILNETTGVISGTPTVLSTPAKLYTITATNGGGSTTGSFTLTVIDIPPTNLRYNPNSQRATRNVAINNMLPSSSGGAVVTYSISPNLPAGLTLNTSTGIISGTLTAVLSGTVQYTIRATNSGGSTTTIVTLVYNTPPSDIALSRSVIYEGNAQGDQIGNLSTTDIDPLDTHTYTLVNGVGSDDNASFTIAGNQLRAAETFVFASKSSYTVRVRTTDNGGLFFEKVIIVSILELPTLTGTNSAQFNGGPSPNPVISRGFSTQLSIKGTDIVSVQWTPSTGLSATNILNPIARPTVTTTYTVTIRNSAGAVVVMKVTVEVKDDYFVEPANILTPNRDGINDFWIIKNLDSYPQNEVSIFDRNGKMLYRMTNYNNRWDGRINGRPLSTGTYYYTLRFPERPSILHKGFITIIQ